MFPDRASFVNRVDELRREMDRLWANMGVSHWPYSRTAAYPAMNIWDCGDAICVEAEVPGVGKDDLEILAVGNELTVKGRRPPLEGKLTYHRQERGTGEFTRVITLPGEVNADKVEAVLEHGVLTIKLPKAESAKPRHITVKTG